MWHGDKLAPKDFRMKCHAKPSAWNSKRRLRMFISSLMRVSISTLLILQRLHTHLCLPTKASHRSQLAITDSSTNILRKSYFFVLAATKPTRWLPGFDGRKTSSSPTTRHNTYFAILYPSQHSNTNHLQWATLHLL